MRTFLKFYLYRKYSLKCLVSFLKPPIGYSKYSNVGLLYKIKYKFFIKPIYKLDVILYSILKK
jgi:hypothetical protein